MRGRLQGFCTACTSVTVRAGVSIQCWPVTPSAASFSKRSGLATSRTQPQIPSKSKSAALRGTLLSCKVRMRPAGTGMLSVRVALSQAGAPLPWVRQMDHGAACGQARLWAKVSVCATIPSGPKRRTSVAAASGSGR